MNFERIRGGIFIFRLAEVGKRKGLKKGMPINLLI